MKTTNPSLPQTQKVLWATRIGDEDWQEELITEKEADIPAASEWAKANGFDRLRVAVINLKSAAHSFVRR